MELFKKDTKGKIRSLKIYAEGDEVVQISGLLGGKKTETRSKCVAKNVGKANETTPEEQAIQEARSKYTDKLSKGYFATQDEAENEVVILPMLAKDAKKELAKIAYPCYIQPKLDGMRCLSNVAFPMTSRAGKEIDTLPHILSLVKSLGLQIDGELYAHGLTFQENISLIKKYRAGESEQVKYHVYDIVSDEAFGDRHDMIIDALAPYVDEDGVGELVELVPTFIIFSEEHLKEIHELFVSKGYEGSIIRHTDDGYKPNGRSRSLLKYKDFIDEAFTIIDVIPLEARPEQGQFVCDMGDGNTFKAMIKGSFEYREEALRNKEEFIGQTAEIRFFEYTDDGMPRFPVAYGIRLDK